MFFDKKQIVNIIAHEDDKDKILRNLIKYKYVQMIDAHEEIKKRINDNLIEFKKLPELSKEEDYITEAKSKLDKIMKILSFKIPDLQNYEVEDYDFKEDVEKIDEIYKDLVEKNNLILKIKSEIDDLKKLKEYLTVSKKFNDYFIYLLNMNYVRFKFGKLMNYSMDKIKKNYENIAAIIFKIYKNKDETFVFILVPKVMELEVNRVLNSVNFKEYDLEGFEYKNLEEYLKVIEEKENILMKRLNYLNDELCLKKDKLYSDILKYTLHVNMEMEIQKLKPKIIKISDFFIIAACISMKKKNLIENILEPLSQRIIVNYYSS